MGWSTRELAELAGTSLRTVRHYHEVGLLDEPDRSSNGYKQYGVTHLVRLLKVKRLTDLGFSLSQIAAMEDTDDHPEQALRTLDAELAGTIERLQRARVELALILRHSAPTDLPSKLALATIDADMTDADRSFSVVMTRLLGPSALEAYGELIRTSGDLPDGHAFDGLPADADEKTRTELAERMIPQIRTLYTRHPGLLDNSGALDASRTAQAFDVAMDELYNPAQIDVVRRITESFSNRPPLLPRLHQPEG